MILGTAYSIGRVPVRLTDERWEHVLDQHPEDFSYLDFEMTLDTVEDPEYILRGRGGALIAVAEISGDFLHVYYREASSTDGFVITAYYKTSFDRSKVIWRKYDDG